MVEKKKAVWRLLEGKGDIFGAKKGWGRFPSLRSEGNQSRVGLY